MKSVKTFTLSADESLIQKARQKAQNENSSLNQRFRDWLASYVGASHISQEYTDLMDSLTYVDPGRCFTREEMNERQLLSRYEYFCVLF